MIRRCNPIGALAQLGERLLCKHQVIGSIPIGSTIFADAKMACLFSLRRRRQYALAWLAP
jgi:hypothetical protein